MNNPAFSVIVCVKNGEKFLKLCLDSIVSQSFRDIEIIIVDDGSTDKTSEICEAYAARDDRIYVLHQQNTGKSIALKAGIKKACGSYLSIVDSDDWIEKDYYAFLSKYADDKLDMVVQGFTIEPSHQIIRSNYSIKNKCVTGLELINSNDVIHTANDACFSWRMLFRREFVTNNSLYPHPQIVIGEDTEMNLRALKFAEQVICTDYAGYHYRSDNQGSLMRRHFLPTFENDLLVQFPTRLDASISVNYQKDMAKYYLTSVIYRVLENLELSTNGVHYSDLKRVFKYSWLKVSYLLVGNNLRSLFNNKKEYFLQLLIKYRLVLLFFLINLARKRKGKIL